MLKTFFVSVQISMFLLVSLPQGNCSNTTAMALPVQFSKIGTKDNFKEIYWGEDKWTLSTAGDSKPIIRIQHFLPSERCLPGQLHIVTTVQLKHFPKDKNIILSNLRFKDKHFKKLLAFKISPYFIQIDGKFLPDQCLFFSSEGFVPGEVIGLRFEIPEDQVSYECSFIPHPILVKNKASTVLFEAVLTEISPPTQYTILIKGRTESDNIKFTSYSFNERIEGEIAKGCEKFTVFPGVFGKSGGISRIVFNVNNEEISMQLPWGQALVDFLEKPLTHNQSNEKENGINI